jgi:hypothetical protein
MTARGDEIAAAVAAYDAANPLAPLPRNAARLLIVMFPASNVCRRSFDDLAASGFSRRTLPVTLEQLVKAGFLYHQRGLASDTYWLNLPPVRR